MSAAPTFYVGRLSKMMPENKRLLFIKHTGPSPGMLNMKAANFQLAPPLSVHVFHAWCQMT